MSVCSETFLFQNLLWRFRREIAENDLCTCLLSKPLLNLKYLPRFLSPFFKGFSVSVFSRKNECRFLLVALCRSHIARPCMTDATNSWWTFSNIDYSHRCIRSSLKNDCLCSLLAATVTNHQVIILLAGKIASASMTTFSTHCISMRIKTIYGRRVQAEVQCAADSPCEEIWEKEYLKRIRLKNLFQ